MSKSILKEKSFRFAVRIVKLSRFLVDENREFVLSKQILKSGTAIGALIRETEFAQSRADFINKMSIALNGANETDYWLDLLQESEYINESVYNSLKRDCEEIISMLVATIKTSKRNK
jgi:four helix bundle protein